MRSTCLAGLGGAFLLTVLFVQPAPAGSGVDATLPPPQTVGVAIPDGRIEQAIAALGGRAEEMLSRSGLPGLAVAVVHDGRTVYAAGFGLRRAGEPAAVDADTVFQLASLSKPIGATVVARQVGEGLVDWDTPATAHLPWFALEDPWVSQQVTIADLYAHRAGLTDHAGDDLEDLGYDRRAVLERLRHAPQHSFRDRYAYTNFGMTAAAEAVAAAAGQDWATLSEEAIYRPLGMTSTSSRFADFEQRENRAYGHVRSGEGFEPLYQRRPDAQSPAGGVSSSANDFARWMAMVLQEGVYGEKTIVAPEALLPALIPQVISSPAYAPDARASFYGFGFGVGVQPSGRVMLSHSGAFALGAATTFMLLPSAQVGIAVFSNGAPIGAVEALAADFMDEVQFGAITRDWYGAYADLFRSFSDPFGSLVGQEPPAEPAPPGPLESYAGTYGNDYYGEALIESSAEGLILEIGPARLRYPLQHWDGDDFYFSLEGENAAPGSLSALSFETDAAGAVKALTIEFYDEAGLGSFTRTP